MPVSRRKFLGMSVAALGSALALSTGYLYWESRLALERVQIPIKNLHPALEGFTIVQLSDFHFDSSVEIELIKQAVALANSLNPDVLVLGGDYVTFTAESIFELGPLLAGLNARHGVFGIIGNHDIWTDLPVVKQGLAEARLPLLVNQGVPLAVGKAQLYLAGLDDAWNGRPNLRAALADCPPDAPVVLLAHEPDPADYYAQDARVSLQLSGHSHGGQVRLPGGSALILPYLGQKYDMGLYRVNQTWVYTNRGLGTVVEPVRLNCAPEVTEFTLVGA